MDYNHGVEDGDRPNRVGLVGCVKTKLPGPAKARDLYVSTMFEGRRRFVERSCARWFVLSAKHGLLDPDEIIEPYDVSLARAPVSERRSWAARTLAELDAVMGPVEDVTFEIHAGAQYRDFGLVQGLRSRGAQVVVPAQRLSQGKQLQFYADDDAPPARQSSTAPQVSRRTSSVGSATGPAKYAPLTAWLDGQSASTVRASFAEIERILNFTLPASARRHQAWSANTGVPTAGRAHGSTAAGVPRDST